MPIINRNNPQMGYLEAGNNQNGSVKSFYYLNYSQYYNMKIINYLLFLFQALKYEIFPREEESVYIFCCSLFQEKEFKNKNDINKVVRSNKKSYLNILCCPPPLTLYGPRFFTEHASFTFRPAGAVMFSMISVNSGSSETTEKRFSMKTF